MKKITIIFATFLGIIFSNYIAVVPTFAFYPDCNTAAPSRFAIRDFSNCDFSNANLTNANLKNANLTNANLTNANLTGADLTNANLTNANLTNANLTSANVLNTKFDRTNLTDANLTNMSVGPNFTGANLTRAILTGTNVSGITLMNCNLTSADLSGLSFDTRYLSIDSSGVTGTPAAMPTGWGLRSGHLIGPGASISGMDLASLDLTTVRLGHMYGTPATIPDGWVLRSGFLIGPGADLTNANFYGYSISAVDFGHVNLTNANLWTLSITNLQGANVTGSNLQYADLRGVNSGDVIGTPNKLPTGWILANGHFIGSGVNLDNVNLSDADLTGVKSDGLVTGTPSALPAEWRLVDGYLVGPGADLTLAALNGKNLAGAMLTSANLTYANLSGTNLSDANLDGANLTAANLANTNLSGARLGVVSGDLRDPITGVALQSFHGFAPRRIVGTPSAMPSNYRIIGGCIVGPKVVVRNVYFGSEDFGGLDLSNADFGFTNLRNVNLAGVNFTNTNLMEATLRDLTNANLTGANLIRANLSNANLTNATIDGTIFTDGGGAVPYYDANFTGIISSGLVGTPVSLPSGYVLYERQILRLLTNHPKPILASATFNVSSSYSYSPSENPWDSGVTQSVQWFIDDVPIPQATSQSYTPKIGDINKHLTVAVTGTASGYKPYTSISDAQLVQPALMAAQQPTIVGTLKIGKTIRVVASSWVSGASISIQWLLDGKVIKGANKTSYAIRSSDKKHRVSVKVTQTKPGYQTVSLTSASTVVR